MSVSLLDKQIAELQQRKAEVIGLKQVVDFANTLKDTPTVPQSVNSLLQAVIDRIEQGGASLESIIQDGLRHLSNVNTAPMKTEETTTQSNKPAPPTPVDTSLRAALDKSKKSLEEKRADGAWLKANSNWFQKQVLVKSHETQGIVVGLDHAKREILITLKTGNSVSVPVEDIQELEIHG